MASKGCAAEPRTEVLPCLTTLAAIFSLFLDVVGSFCSFLSCFFIFVDGGSAPADGASSSGAAATAANLAYIDGAVDGAPPHSSQLLHRQKRQCAFVLHDSA